jgi:hypothetical protein
MKDIHSAMAVAERLVDFRINSSTSSTDKKKSRNNKKGKGND